MQTCQVLVVEDHEDSRELLLDFLSARGYAVATAEHGREALGQLRAGLRPKLVLLDLTMPVMDGWQLHAELKRDPALAAIPVIVLSAVDRPTLPVGIQGFLPKPVELDLLIAFVEHYCGRRREAR